MTRAVHPYDHDDDLIEGTRADGRPRIRIYRLPHPIVVLGRGSVETVELRVDRCREDRIPVFRRRGGGCAVVIDPGNVIVSVTLPLEGLGGFRRVFADLTSWLIDGLTRVGVPGVQFDGISDLVAGDRKVSGSCVYRAKGLLFYTASLLVDPDFDLVERYLAHPPREPVYRRGRSHRAFMGALRQVMAASTVATQAPAADSRALPGGEERSAMPEPVPAETLRLRLERALTIGSLPAW